YLAIKRPRARVRLPHIQPNKPSQQIQPRNDCAQRPAINIGHGEIAPLVHRADIGATRPLAHWVAVCTTLPDGPPPEQAELVTGVDLDPANWALGKPRQKTRADSVAPNQTLAGYAQHL